MVWSDVSFTDLSEQEVTTAETQLIALLSEQFPDLDFNRGVFRGQLIHPAAIILAAQKLLGQRVLNSGSLANIATSSDLVDDELVDALLSNFRITRQPAEKATGNILLIFSQSALVVISAGTIFKTNSDVEFSVTKTIYGQSNSEYVLSDADRYLEPRADGTYGFLVPVEASVAGVAGNITRDTPLISSVDIPLLIGAYAAEDFKGGRAAETTAQLISKLSSGLNQHVFNSRGTLLNLLRSASTDIEYVTNDFKNIKAVSIVGMGDSVMTRDKRGLFPISMGGRCDVYLRSTYTPEHKQLSVSANLIEKTLDGGIWQFSLSKNDAPGFYDIITIRREKRQPGSENFDVISDIRNVDLTGSEYIPDITDVLSAVYSPYQTATIRFLDTATETALLDIGATKNYEITVRYMPLLRNVQLFLSSDDIRAPDADILVKAPIPNFLTINVSLVKPASIEQVDISSMKNAIYEMINSLPFGSSVYSGDVISAISSYIPTNVRITGVTLTCKTILPDGTIHNNVSNDVISPIEDVKNYSSALTNIMFIYYDDINISVS